MKIIIILVPKSGCFITIKVGMIVNIIGINIDENLFSLYFSFFWVYLYVIQLLDGINGGDNWFINYHGSEIQSLIPAQSRKVESQGE